MTQKIKAQMNACHKKPAFLCGGCRVVAYCSKECQISDWLRGHHLVCIGVSLEEIKEIKDAIKRGDSAWIREKQISREEIMENNYLEDAVKTGDPGIVDSILGKVENGDTGVLEHRTEYDNRTPLHLAARFGYTEVAKMLIEREANKEARDYSDMTPLHFAAFKGHTEVAALLIERGVEVDARDDDNWTPLHWAAARGHTEVVAFLIENGAELDARSNEGETPLNWAARKGQSRTMWFLLRRGAEPVEDDICPDGERGVECRRVLQYFAK